MQKLRTQPVVRKIEALRTIAYPFGIGPLTDLDEQAILNTYGVRHIEDSDLLDFTDGEPYQLTPLIHGTRELHINPRISRDACPAVFSFVRIRAALDSSVADGRIGRRGAPEDLDRVALCAILHDQGCREWGREWQIVQVEQLVHFPELWRSAPLAALLTSLNRIKSVVVGPKGFPTNAMLERLAASWGIAKATRQTEGYGPSDKKFRSLYREAFRASAWEYVIWALVGLGVNRRRQGEFAAANRFLRRAHQAIEKHDLPELRGPVFHEMFSVAAEARRGEETERLARAAFEEYGPLHPRLPRLALDIAYYWRETGHYSRAVVVLAALVPTLTDPFLRLKALGNLAWAAGCTGAVGTYETCSSEIAHLAITEPEGAAFAYLGLAWGACGIERFESARVAARCSIEHAAKRGEYRTLAEAEIALNAAVRHHSPDDWLGLQRVFDEHEGDTLAADLAASLFEIVST